jgi:hypothetical protein
MPKVVVDLRVTIEDERCATPELAEKLLLNTLTSEYIRFVVQIKSAKIAGKAGRPLGWRKTKVLDDTVTVIPVGAGMAAEIIENESPPGNGDGSLEVE